MSQRLKVIYSDHSLSVVRLSLTFSSKYHLLLNHLTNFNQTSQEWSFGNPLSKLFNDLISMKSFGCCGIKKGGKYPIIKNSSPLKPLVRNVHWVTIYKMYSSLNDWLKNIAARRHQKRGKITLFFNPFLSMCWFNFQRNV